jgi:hypothetical protein
LSGAQLSPNGSLNEPGAAFALRTGRITRCGTTGDVYWTAVTLESAWADSGRWLIHFSRLPLWPVA